ncbi:unnamed protein product [Cuscuta campestris]|uniref:Retrotransposon Copia-like N-terminal domain-containing protein n=1 Tax=Cuscuta campestris TaxID=132261 RepID=A0A484KMA5_9ASTE|nr:unnamed protein product [Cuscuta campestris]
MADREEQTYKQDPLFLHNSDHPSMALTSTKLTGANFIPWSRSIKISLISKMKLGFIDGTCRKPAIGSPNYAQWERCDNMVFSWILNSIQSDLAEAFLYASSSVELWKELEERFGQSNGPLIYQIEKKIADQQQNNDSVGTYFTKLKKLWDEMDNVTNPVVCECGGCTCDAKRKVAEAEQRRRLVKFMMGLNDGFDMVRGQILLMPEHPSPSKACSLVQQVERQKSITSVSAIRTEMAACVNNDGTDYQNTALYAGKGGQKQFSYNKNDPRKHKRVCDYCKESEHLKDQCFKLVGYPEWFKGPKGKKGQNFYGGNKFAANIMTHTHDSQAETPLEDMGVLHSNPTFIQNVAQEMMKMMTDKVNSKSSEGVPLNAYAHLAGNNWPIASSVMKLESSKACYMNVDDTVEWIIDTGASDHMTPFEHIFDEMHTLVKPIMVTLPDGSHKAVSKAGHVTFPQNLVLTDVLYVPEFKFNLISVSKLIDTHKLNAQFLPNECVFQDLLTEQVEPGVSWKQPPYFRVGARSAYRHPPQTLLM